MKFTGDNLRLIYAAAMGYGTEGGSNPYKITVAARGKKGFWGEGTPIDNSGYKGRFIPMVCSQVLLTLIIVLCLLCTAVIADIKASNDLEHPIDVSLTNCIKLNSSTVGMNTCTAEAIDNWDKEMNIIYKKLFSRLEVKQKNTLKKSQLAWLKFRDDEFNFLISFYSNFEGTMWTNVLLGSKLNIIKQRTLKLQIYLKTLRENN